MAAMTALIGGLGLAGMMSLNVMERTREIGVTVPFSLTIYRAKVIQARKEYIRILKGLTK